MLPARPCVCVSSAAATVVAVVVAVTPACALTWLPNHCRGGEAARSSPQLLPPVFDWKSVHKSLPVPLDHSVPEERLVGGRFFNLSYFVDDSYWDQESGPIFVEMGQEAPTGGVRAGALHRTHKALAVAVEHRFYGSSIPYNDRSVDMLKYLTVGQNLADTAYVIEHIQASLDKRRVVINFGGSYSGATAAWLREKYPNVTHAASSSSGVVNAILNFVGFDKQVAMAVDRPVPGCAELMKAVTSAFETAQNDGLKAWNKAKEVMGAEHLIGTPLGDDDFWYMLADSAAMAVQYGNKKALCDHLQVPYKTSPSPSSNQIISNFANFTATFWGTSFSSTCFYDSECLKNLTNLDMSRSWRWQKCTELAYLQAGYPHSLRHEQLSLDRLLNQCKYVFGDEVYSSDCHTARTNNYFGGATMEGSSGKPSRIIFMDFSDDPWQRASVQSTLGPDLPYCMTTCDGCGHCGAGVPHNLTKCTDMEADYVAKWLAEAETELAMKLN